MPENPINDEQHKQQLVAIAKNILEHPFLNGYEHRVLTGDIDNVTLRYVGSVSIFPDASDPYTRIRLVEMPIGEERFFLSFLTQIQAQPIQEAQVIEWLNQETNSRLAGEKRPYVVLGFCEYDQEGIDTPQQLISMCTENGMLEDTALAFLRKSIVEHLLNKTGQSELDN